MNAKVSNKIENILRFGVPKEKFDILIIALTMTFASTRPTFYAMKAFGMLSNYANVGLKTW